MANIEIVEFWCSDCRAHTAFEVVPVDGVSPDREWACLTCGAAYIEIGDVAEVDAGIRGVA